MPPVIVPEAAGSRWEMEPGRIAAFRILSSETAGATAVFEETVPAGEGTPLHIHHTSDELILVRDGTFRFRTDNQTAEVGPGSWVYVPRGLTHGWRNTGATTGHLSFVFMPGSGAVCFEELARDGRNIRDVREAELIATFTRHGYELVSFDWD
jgi:quercetin dioxygenase-like cupin family protein